MNWSLSFTLLIPSTIAVVGWFFVHQLANKRERAARKREARVKALEQCFIKISLTSGRTLNSEMSDDIERFVSEIQLYGTPAQVEMMKGVVEEFKKPEFRVSWDELLISLRDELRSELRLEPISGPVWWLKLSRNFQNVPNQSTDPTSSSGTPGARHQPRHP